MPTLPLRVQQSTSTSGTGTIALNAAVAGRRSYRDAYGTGTTRVTYVISGATFFEIGYGDFDGGNPGSLTRATVIASSNAGALVSLPVGTADVFPVINPGERGVIVGSGNITLALADTGNMVVWSGTAAASLNLPAVASVPNGRGWLVRNLGSDVLTIDPAAAELIDGVTTLALAPGNSVEILRAGTQYVSIGSLPGALASPPPIGATTPAAGKFTTLAATDDLDVTGGATLRSWVTLTDGGLTVSAGNIAVTAGTISAGGDIAATNGNLSATRAGALAALTLNSVGGSGRIWQLISGTNGYFSLADSTAGANRMVIDTGGSVTFAGATFGPTAAGGTNNTQLATTAFVAAAIAGVPGFSHGSNGNGSYMTIGGGTLQICRFRLVMPGGTTSWSWTFPLAFSATPQIFVFPEASATGNINLASVSASSVSGSVTGSSGTLSMMAIL